MTFEHVAYNVREPGAIAEWYVEHLGLQIARHVGGPTDTHFLADSTGRVLIELYHNPKAPVPDYAARDPLVFHVAFAVDSVEEAWDRLIAAGATPAEKARTTPAGDTLAMLRDPWGIPLQLVRRRVPM